MAEAAQGQLLELADPLPSQVELVADLLERAGHAVVEAVAQGEDASLALGKALDRLAQRVGDIHLFGELHRIGGVLVLDEVSELSAVLADRLLERDCVGHSERQLDLVDGDAGFVGDLLGTGIPTELGLEARLGGTDRGQRVMEMDGDANGTGLVGDRPGDGLTDPPRGVRGELEALAPVELLDGADQAKVALLDEVEEVDAGRVGVATGVGHHEAEVGSEERILGLAAFPLGAAELDFFLLVLEVASFESLSSLLACFDLLSELYFLLRRQQVVLADGGQVLRDEVGGEATALVSELALEARPLGLAVQLRIGSRHERQSSLGIDSVGRASTMPENPSLVNPPFAQDFPPGGVPASLW